MKAFLTLITCLMISLGSVAQDPQLFENPWFLQKITIDSNDLFPPNDGSASLDSYFFETEGTFNSGFCDFFSQPIQYDSTDSFTLDNNPVFLIGFCDNPTALQFDEDFFSIFFEKRMMAKNPFNYSIEDVNDTKTLVIINIEGDQAVFGSTLMAVAGFKKQTINVFPNPVKNHLNFTSNVLLKSARIFNVQGREMYTAQFQQNNQKINTETLKPGVYFLKVESDTGEQLTTKFVKE